MGAPPTLAPAADATALAASLRGWLGSGSPQSPGGAFYAWIDEASGEPAFEYPEITGYALTYFSGLRDPEDREVAAAELAARWLLRRLGAGNLAARSGWDGDAVYAFDLGVIASGLINFGRRFGREECVARGVWLAAMLRARVERQGYLRPLLSDETSRPSSWSTEGRAHLIKLVQALLLADEVAGGFRRAARMLASTAEELQEPDGRLRTHRPGSPTALHAHLYGVEGLWMYARATGDKVALERTLSATRWTWNQRLPDGSFPRTTPTDAGSVVDQLDVAAQALRMNLLMGLDDGDEATVLAHLTSAARPADGCLALVYQPGAAAHHNCWVTMFAAQAAEIAAGTDLDWRKLV